MGIFHEGTHKVSKFATEEDIISSMPDNVITNVLDRLPIQVAVKTGVLSKDWRLKWTLLTQLVFDSKFFRYLLGLGKKKKYSGRDIGRFLLHLKGPITKFVLYIPPDNKVLDYKDIYHWVLFLSRKGCKELALLNMTSFRLKLPTQLYSCIELKHLKLEGCCFRLLSSFSGFPNLLSLELGLVTFESYNWAEFVSQCPLLEILKISSLVPIDEHELNQIAKLVNLKTLYLTLITSFSECELNQIAKLVNLKTLYLTLIASSSISEFILSPKLQELTLCFYNFMFLAEAGAIKVLTAFLCVKTLTLSGVAFNEFFGYMGQKHCNLIKLIDVS